MNRKYSTLPLNCSGYINIARYSYKLKLIYYSGVHESIWRANYFIFEKLKHEGFSGNEEVNN